MLKNKGDASEKVASYAGINWNLEKRMNNDKKHQGIIDYNSFQWGFHHNPASNCWNISLKITQVNLMEGWKMNSQGITKHI